jgi:hypothetical protein
MSTLGTLGTRAADEAQSMTKRPPEAMVALNVGQPISLGGGVNQNNLVHTRMARPRASQLPAGAPAHIRARPHVVAAAASARQGGGAPLPRSGPDDIRRLDIQQVDRQCVEIGDGTCGADVVPGESLFDLLLDRGHGSQRIIRRRRSLSETPQKSEHPSINEPVRIDLREGATDQTSRVTL